jgi:hypothetical protein
MPTGCAHLNPDRWIREIEPRILNQGAVVVCGSLQAERAAQAGNAIADGGRCFINGRIEAKEMFSERGRLSLRS